MFASLDLSFISRAIFFLTLGLFLFLLLPETKLELTLTAFGNDSVAQASTPPNFILISQKFSEIQTSKPKPLNLAFLSGDNVNPISVTLAPPNPLAPTTTTSPNLPLSPAVTLTAPADSTPAPADLEGLFQKSGQTYGVDPEKLKRIARCESNFHHDSVNPVGPYVGMYQYSKGTWVSTRKAMGENPDPALMTNAREAIRTSAWKIAHGGLDAWPVCGKL